MILSCLFNSMVKISDIDLKRNNFLTIQNFLNTAWVKTFVYIVYTNTAGIQIDKLW